MIDELIVLWQTYLRLKNPAFYKTLSWHQLLKTKPTPRRMRPTTPQQQPSKSFTKEGASNELFDEMQSSQNIDRFPSHQKRLVKLLSLCSEEAEIVMKAFDYRSSLKNH